jgi:Uma2 family endonuclease
MAVTSTLLTVADFMSLPDHANRWRQELHHGELFEMPPVKLVHTRIQSLVVRALNELLFPEFEAFNEFPFRPLPEYEVWTADIAVVDKALADSMPSDGYFTGTPPIVIEVLSPSNTASEMLDRERICLANGGREFWLIDPKHRTVKVTTAQGLTRSYSGSDTIPLDAVRPGLSLLAARIFPE